MRSLIRRAAVAAGAAVAVLGVAVGVAAASAAPPVLAFSPSRFDFGQVTVGQAAAQTFTLANTGGRASRAVTVTLSGPAAFTITADACTATSLGPGTSCTVTVRFAPARTGTAAATLTAANNKKAVLATDSLTGTGASASHLYWASGSAGTIVEASLGGTGAHVIASGQGEPAGVAVDTRHLYWSSSHKANGGAGTIVQAGLDGTGAHVIASGQGRAVGVAVGPQ